LVAALLLCTTSTLLASSYAWDAPEEPSARASGLTEPAIKILQRLARDVSSKGADGWNTALMQNEKPRRELQSSHDNRVPTDSPKALSGVRQEDARACQGKLWRAERTCATDALRVIHGS